MARNNANCVQDLTDMQRKAVEWTNGPLLVLAGPGSGKTRVLTHRIARLLENPSDKHFRILGLTFTNKAAHEMKERLSSLIPDSVERAEINTFHGFCTQLLRQHGVHCGLKPNFKIFSQKADQQAILADALQRQAGHWGKDEKSFMLYIDALKKRLIDPKHTTPYLSKHTQLKPDHIHSIQQAYQLYEDELNKCNALDFNSLICLAYKLMGHAMLARHYQTVFRYWHIDEFQDTSYSQYQLLQRMAGTTFRQLFVVADDDQTIYEWNGASVQSTRNLVADFECDVIQLTTNFRCPSTVVEAANRLIVYNVRRNVSKATAAPSVLRAGIDDKIAYRVYSDENEEALEIATEISTVKANEREECVVLARSRAILEPVRTALNDLNITNVMLGQRYDFVSPQMRWLMAYIKQISRPLDRRNMVTLVEAFQCFTGIHVDIERLTMRSETDQVTLLQAWLAEVQQVGIPSSLYFEAITDLASGKLNLSKNVNYFNIENSDCDLSDDLVVWRRINRDIRQTCGGDNISLEQFLEEVEKYDKEPTLTRGAVSLSTIHRAKGMEFSRVYLIGLAEEVFPSWHSVNRRNCSIAIEEERRSCFVAVTRTKRHLTLSRARSYKGWTKKPSRFLTEMRLIAQNESSRSKVAL